MKTFWFEKKFKYDGSQLRSLFGYLEGGVLGDSIVGWQGECNIPFDKMVDGEDLRAREEIRGSHMVHFIIEKFQPHLGFGVALQRLFASIVKDSLEQAAPEFRGKMVRDGDDIYIDGLGKPGAKRGKLSISIATVSPVSLLIHFAVNVSNEGTPVSTASLEDLKIDPSAWARDVMSRFALESKSVEEATQKVFWVK